MGLWILRIWYWLKGGFKVAYSNYGAYIWKNGIDITSECADMRGVHALLEFPEFRIEFYKTHEPVLVSSEKVVTISRYEYEDKEMGLEIEGYFIDKDSTIAKYEITYKCDVYCVIIGACVGNGWDKTKVSKYLKKNIEYDDDLYRYYINTKHDVDSMIVIDSLIRKDDLRHEKYCMRRFAIIPLIKDILRLNIMGIEYNYEALMQYKEKIKWMK